MDAEQELRIYKLIATDENYGMNLPSEFGWVSERTFIVWVPYAYIQLFSEALINIFSYDYYMENGGVNTKMQERGMAIDLTSIIFRDELEDVFPRDKYTY